MNNVPAPTLYRYEQPLIRDTHVKRFDGREIQVRKWNKAEGNWTITPAGQDYFKYNRSEFVVDVPYVRGVPAANGKIDYQATVTSTGFRHVVQTVI